MEEMNNTYTPPTPPPAPKGRVRTFFLTGRKELFFALLCVVCGIIMADFTLFGGYNLGFASAVIAFIVCAVGYQLAAGCRMTPYSAGLIGLSMIIAAGFARSDDGLMKFFMILLMTISVNLGLCLMAGQNRRAPGGVSSLLDVPRTLFAMTFGQLARSSRGMIRALRGKGSLAKKIGAIVIGLLVMLPIMGIVISLLVSADAAFDGMMQVLPKINFWEAVFTVPIGVGLAILTYTRSVALRHRPRQAPATGIRGKKLNHLTIDTVLLGICLVYLLYLFSQLAYFFGAFAGFLPEEFTRAEYARRGFFEMAWLCGINMTLITLAMWLVRKPEGKAPLSTRLLCLFIGLVTVFMVLAASAKMAMYIDSFGLTRLRVFTEIIMVFLGLMAAAVALWLFAPKLPYMKVLMIGALLLGAAVIWVDVDTTIAAYNVTAYQYGHLEEVDLDYLSELNDGAIPYIARLTEDSDPEVAAQAKQILAERYSYWEDFREWNYVNWNAGNYVTGELAEDYEYEEENIFDEEFQDF